MQVFQGFEALPQLHHTVVTVGSYDGVHVGHQALITRLVEEAHRRNAVSVVVTFEPHPRIALGRGEGMRLLTTFEQKRALLERMGVDVLIVAPFDERFRALSGKQFLLDYLVCRLRAEAIVAGYNHRFGHDRIACSALFEELSLSAKPDIIVVDECRAAGEHVSSTAIRRLLEEGRTADAERLLGHPLTF